MSANEFRNIEKNLDAYMPKINDKSAITINAAPMAINAVLGPKIIVVVVVRLDSNNDNKPADVYNNNLPHKYLKLLKQDIIVFRKQAR